MGASNSKMMEASEARTNAAADRLSLHIRLNFVYTTAWLVFHLQ